MFWIRFFFLGGGASFCSCFVFHEIIDRCVWRPGGGVRVHVHADGGSGRVVGLLCVQFNATSIECFVFFCFFLLVDWYKSNKGPALRNVPSLVPPSNNR